MDNASQIVETQQPLSVPGIEGFLIPSKTRGHVLKLIDGNTALVRWEVNNKNYYFSRFIFVSVFFCHGHFNIYSLVFELTSI